MECCSVVTKVQEMIMKEAQLAGIELSIIENKKAGANGALLSATLLAQGHNLDAFIKEWKGTVQ